jgi:hypothetical protein
MATKTQETHFKLLASFLQTASPTSAFSPFDPFTIANFIETIN